VLKRLFILRKEYIHDLKINRGNSVQLKASRFQLESANRDRCQLRSELNIAKEKIEVLEEQKVLALEDHIQTIYTSLNINENEELRDKVGGVEDRLASRKEHEKRMKNK